MIVSPSILSMDFSKKEEEINKLNQTDAEFIHLDVMDGYFVSNKTFDEQFIKTKYKFVGKNSSFFLGASSCVFA